MAQLKFSLTESFPCGYLSDQEERLLIYADPLPMSDQLYGIMMEYGYRRSENQVYKPYCDHCQACIPIRLQPKLYRPSRAQQRIGKRIEQFRFKLTTQPSTDYYPLYQHYINTVHADGVMFPASESQLDSFARCDWLTMHFLEAWQDDKLVAVTVVDVVDSAWSAVYTFYDPAFAKYSLGKMQIMKLISLAAHKNITYLYLGYYVASCQKMNYKTEFKPHQKLIDGLWHTFK